MTKKSFKDTNAAALFISDPAPAPAQTPPADPPAGAPAPQGYKVNPAFIETKSKRVQLLMQPSLYARLKAAATAQGLSVNDYIHRALEKATAEQE